MAEINRADNTKLPDSSELSSILDTEQDRSVPPEKADLHYADFNAIIAILDQLDLSSAIFTEPAADIHGVIERGQALVNEAVAHIVGQEPLPELRRLLDAAYDYLSETDKAQPSDLIFVFGSKTPLRMEVAIELFQKGLAPKIMISGGNPIYGGETPQSEADRYLELGLAEGIQREQMILEDQSITIPDNVRSSLNLLDKLDEAPKSLILVNSPYSQRRGWATMSKYVAEDTKLYRVNCGTKPEFSREHWFEQENTASVVLNEFVKLRASEIHGTS